MDELEKAIKTVHSGGAMINPEVATKVVDFFSEMAQSNYDTSIHAQNVEEITEAEWEIIKLVGRGLSNKEISAELSLSEGTVRNYLSTILNKLDLRDRTQLAIWEVQSGSPHRIAILCHHRLPQVSRIVFVPLSALYIHR